MKVLEVENMGLLDQLRRYGNLHATHIPTVEIS